MTSVRVHHQIDMAPDLPADAPTVVFSGSLGSTLEMWDLQAAALSDQFRVVRYDTRGHGRSPMNGMHCSIDDLADDLVALLDRLGLERAHVVGLSLGGMTAMRLAARNPDRVDRLALLCTSALLGPARNWLDRAATVRAEGTGAVAGTVVTRWFSEGFLAARPDLVSTYREMIAATPPAGYAACCEAIAEMDLRTDLPSIAAPTLVIGGMQDPATPTPHLEAIAEAIRDSRLLMLDPAAHLANVEQSAAVNAALAAHFGVAKPIRAEGPAAESVGNVRDNSPVGRRTVMSDQQRYDGGMTVRRAVLGDAHVDRSVAGTTEFTGPFQDFITRYAWGDIWSRPGLDRKSRSMITLALLTALGQEHELGMHVAAALRNGLTRAEIQEVLLHCGVYAGVPAANRAFAVSQQVFDQLDQA